MLPYLFCRVMLYPNLTSHGRQVHSSSAKQRSVFAHGGTSRNSFPKASVSPVIWCKAQTGASMGLAVRSITVFGAELHNFLRACHRALASPLWEYAQYLKTANLQA